MPKVYEEAGLTFFFYSSDMDEPPHIHVEYKEGGTMKVWLREGLPVEWVKVGLPNHKQTEANQIIEKRQKIFLNNWKDIYQNILVIFVKNYLWI